jgi:HK97 family phage portal protein
MDWVKEWLRGQDLDDSGRGGATLINAYSQSVWVYAAVNALAVNVAEVEFKFCTRTPGAESDENPIESGPLVDLFNRPHRMYHRFAFWESYVTWLALRGEAFILPQRVGRNKWEMLILSPDNFMHIVQDHELVGWRYTGSSYSTPLESQVFLPEEIIHDKLPNPFNLWRGMSPLQVATLAAQTDYAAGQFMKGLMMNNADTGVIVTTEQQLSPEQREVVLAALRDRKRLAGTADRPLLLFAGAKVEKPSLSSTDMQFLENRKFNRQEICAVYGVPQELLGFTEDANRSVSDSARLNFTEHRIAPLCERIEAALDPLVKKIGGPNACGFFDIDTRPIMLQARNSRVDIATKYFAMGVPLNEINRNLDLGLPEFPWGDIGYLPFNLQPSGTAPAETPNTPEVPQQDPAAAGIKRLESALTLALSPRRGKAGDDLHQCQANPEYEAAIAGSIKAKAGRLRKFFFEQRGRVLAAVQQWFNNEFRTDPEQRVRPHPGPLPQERELKANDQRLDLIFDLKNENQVLKQRLKPALVADLEFGGAQLFAELGMADFKLPPEKAIQFLRLREKRIEDINQTTFDKLKGSLQEGLENGESYQGLVDRVKEVFQSASESRAETIATTETNTAVNTGRHEGMVEAKVERKGWKTANLENVRATHAAAERDYGPDSEGVALDEAFRVGGYDLMYPGDPSGPPQEVINCRCFSFAMIPQKSALTLALSPRRGKAMLTWEEWESERAG